MERVLRPTVLPPLLLVKIPEPGKKSLCSIRKIKYAGLVSSIEIRKNERKERSSETRRVGEKERKVRGEREKEEKNQERTCSVRLLVSIPGLDLLDVLFERLELLRIESSKKFRS